MVVESHQSSFVELTFLNNRGGFVGAQKLVAANESEPLHVQSSVLGL